MNETRSKLWFSGVGYIPYAILAYAYNWLANGTDHDLTVAVMVLLGGRFVYALIDNVTATIAWRLHGRKRAVDAFMKLMQENRMPRHESPSESLFTYLNYLDNDGERNPAIRSAARQISTIIEQSHHEGLMGGSRVEKAAQAAYERYQGVMVAPRA